MQHEKTFQITGMSCGHCVRAVEGALAALEGVEIEQVEIGRATVRFDPVQHDAARIAEAIEAEGYTVAG